MVAAGCSSDEPKQEFTIPKALCGVSVPSNALSRLLPASGKRLTVDERGTLDDGNVSCQVNVDNHDMVVVLNSERIDAGDSAQSILQSRLSISQQKSVEGGSIAYADQAAVSLIECRGAGIEREDISTLVRVLKPGRPDESAMKSLISGYTAALKQQRPCRQGS